MSLRTHLEVAAWSAAVLVARVGALAALSLFLLRWLAVRPRRARGPA